MACPVHIVIILSSACKLSLQLLSVLHTYPAGLPVPNDLFMACDMQATRQHEQMQLGFAPKHQAGILGLQESCKLQAPERLFLNLCQ